MEELSKLFRDNLFDRVPLSSMTILHPNEALDWNSFNSMWSMAMTAYLQRIED
jgi:hypothetical protein